MKKIFTLIMLAGLVAACSTDEETIDGNALTAKKAETSTLKNGQLINECFANLTAYYSNTGSLEYPVWVFTANMPAGVAPASGYSVQLEIQGTDCEDITIGYGSIIVYPGGMFYDVSNNRPSVTKPQSQLPGCYRWRLRITGPGDAKNSSCTQTTPWCDNPLG